MRCALFAERAIEADLARALPFSDLVLFWGGRQPDRRASRRRRRRRRRLRWQRCRCGAGGEDRLESKPPVVAHRPKACASQQQPPLWVRPRWAGAAYTLTRSRDRPRAKTLVGLDGAAAPVRDVPAQYNRKRERFCASRVTQATRSPTPAVVL